MTGFVFVLMCLTAYRATRLVVRDTVPPVLWLRDRLVGGPREPVRAEVYHEAYPNDLEPGVSRLVPGLPGVWYLGPEGQVLVHRAPWKWSPHWLAELLSCPWCASAYVSGTLTAAVDVSYGVPVPWLVGPAVWAVSAFLASREEL